jgi:hypothetical protein
MFPALPSTVGQSLFKASVFEDGSQPRNGLLGGDYRRGLGRVLATREVANRRPGAHIRGILTKFLESPAAIGPREHVNAPSALWGLVASND